MHGRTSSDAHSRAHRARRLERGGEQASRLLPRHRQRARSLCRDLRHGRGQCVVLSRGPRGDLRILGRPDSRGLPLQRQDQPRHHPCGTPVRQRQARAGPRADDEPGRQARRRPHPTAADPRQRSRARCGLPRSAARDLRRHGGLGAAPPLLGRPRARGPAGRHRDHPGAHRDPRARIPPPGRRGLCPAPRHPAALLQRVLLR